MQTYFVPRSSLESLYKYHVLEMLEEMSNDDWYAIIKAYDGNSTALVHVNFEKNVLELVQDAKTLKNVIAPKNAEQACYLDALMREEYKCVAAYGATGSGKTLLAIAQGINAVNQEKYDAITLIKPHTDVGKGIGYLPGSIDEKMDPYYQSFYYAMKWVLRNGVDGYKYVNPVEQWKDQEKLEILPVNYARGITLENRWIIIDEAQNLTQHEIKTLLTRVGDQSKVVICGDTEQVDVGALTHHNGLTTILQQFAAEEFFCAIRLVKVLRGPVADAADRLL